MYFKQSSIVPALVTLTLSNLGEATKKNKQTKSLMSLININLAQNNRTDTVSFFSHKKAFTFGFRSYCSHVTLFKVPNLQFYSLMHALSMQQYHYHHVHDLLLERQPAEFNRVFPGLQRVVAP